MNNELLKKREQLEEQLAEINEQLKEYDVIVTKSIYKWTIYQPSPTGHKEGSLACLFDTIEEAKNYARLNTNEHTYVRVVPIFNNVVKNDKMMEARALFTADKRDEFRA